MALQDAAYHCSIEHVESHEQRCRAVALVVMGHGSKASLRQRQAWLTSLLAPGNAV